jgi:hypothetical protein
MAARGAARNRNRKDDSQLDFFTLAFRGHEAASPAQPSPDEPSIGSGTEAIPSEPAAKTETKGADAEAVADTDLSAAHLPPVQNIALDEAQLRNAKNYRITDADRIGSGSLKSKCRANLAAIEVLKRLEAESRPPSQDEKRILVRYVGWGGQPQVFDPWNEIWQQERARLEELLRPEELSHAPQLGLWQVHGGWSVKMSVANTTEAKVSETAHGTMRSVEYALQSLEEAAQAVEQAINETRRRMEDLSAQCGLPFEYSDRLAELVQRQQEIADALDLTKDQASSQLGSDVAENAAVASDGGAMCLAEIGFPEYE